MSPIEINVNAIIAKMASETVKPWTNSDYYRFGIAHYIEFSGEPGQIRCCVESTSWQSGIKVAGHGAYRGLIENTAMVKFQIWETDEEFLYKTFANFMRSVKLTQFTDSQGDKYCCPEPFNVQMKITPNSTSTNPGNLEGVFGEFTIPIPFRDSTRLFTTSSVLHSGSIDVGYSPTNRYIDKVVPLGILTSVSGTYF